MKSNTPYSADPNRSDNRQNEARRVHPSNHPRRGDYINHPPKRSRKSRNLSGNKFLFLLAILIVIAVLIVTCIKMSGKGSSSSAVSSQSSSTALSVTPTLTVAPTPTTVVEDTIVGRFFGPLQPATNPKTITHNELRALYIGQAAHLDENIEIANKSAINAFVIDLKESNGVFFNSQNKMAKDIGAVKIGYNIETVVKKCKANNIKLIGRIVCFKDHVLAAARPDLCIKNKNGNLITYSLEGNKAFVSAYNKEVWQYNIDIAKEAIALGFDEIQFDYIRFPTCDKTRRAAEYFGPAGTVPTKIEAINRFLQTAKIQIQDEQGIPLSADIFGIVLTSKLDGQLIGQDWETVGHLGVDTMSPMIYPSHYAKGTIMSGIKFAAPSADTYKFLNAVFKQEKFSESKGFSHVRCYIQAYNYTQAQIFGQIQALSEHGFKEYIYWNAKGSYTLANMKTE